MPSAVSELYEPLIERDSIGIRDAIAKFREGHSASDLFLAVARFAVLSYTPSQHARHALLSVLSAHDLTQDLGDRFDELLTECAIYTSHSRQPWSEPPMLHPPSPEGAPEDLRTAVASRDRLAGERWLARHMSDPDLRLQLMTIASEDLEDMGHKVIVANAAWRLAELLGDKGRFAALRIAVWEMVAYSGPRSQPPPVTREALDALITRCISEKGSIESAHGVFLFDALSGEGREVPAGPAPLIYPLARDYGQCLKAHAVAKRLRARYPDARVDEFVAAVRSNLEAGPTYEEWNFA